ncbi:MAG TPA: rhodanese-like domain-containing protein [Gammaproteobacteria bacterium]|nr:rhodanese-like domain-containing protein [Gammaproteobacteria bacterium]
MDDFQRLVDTALIAVTEVFPWVLEDEILSSSELIILDIREQNEFDQMHIKGSIHIPRGILESSCVWNYDETVPSLANSRGQNIVTVCRSGKRSALAALTLQSMNFTNVRSLKLGIKGWNDNGLDMVNYNNEIVDTDLADVWLNTIVSKDKLKA